MISSFLLKQNEVKYNLLKIGTCPIKDGDRNGGREMLVSAKEMLQKAKAGHYAVGQFNINNLEWTKSIYHSYHGLIACHVFSSAF